MNNLMEFSRLQKTKNQIFNSLNFRYQILRNPLRKQNYNYLKNQRNNNLKTMIILNLCKII